MVAGRYQILELLGRGGMGAVYKATDCKRSRIVALKIIRPALAQRREVLERFRREFQAARQILHPNVVRLFELGTADGLKFMSMQYVEGQTLDVLLKEHAKLPPENAAMLVRQVGEGLAAAHAKNVVHRDVSPRNIIVDRHGSVVIMDFGVACALDFPSLTRPGELMGTPEYMSPEQVFGEKVDARADLYAMGLILYELLTGERLHKARTFGRLLQLFVDGTAAAIEWNATIPLPLRHIVEKCLHVDRNLRYQSAEAILGDLDVWLGQLAA
jgi:serine/threonine protein kinase